MSKKVLAPIVGESISEVTIVNWSKKNGEFVKMGELLLEIESDKASVEVVAESNGVLKIMKEAGEVVPVGSMVGEIDETAVATASSAKPSNNQKSEATLAPSVRKMVTENKVNPENISGSGKEGRITKGDVIEYLDRSPQAVSEPAATPASVITRDGERRVPMSRLRAKIAERLVMAQHTAAILTTFNEVDMTSIMELRKKYKESFKSKFGVSLGFMSFFTRACCMALQEVPEVNAFIEENDVVYHDYVNMGIAVGSEKGLVVPVLKNAEKMTFVEIEKSVFDLALKARDGKLSIADMSGGTFTISNGGVYGSMMSTPILNPPQSGILGMHKTMERPVVVNGQIVVRPMMYLALSYDHRIVDGKGAVTFLVKAKEYLEDPAKMKMEFTHEL